MNVDATDDSKRDLIERLLKRPVTGATHAVWGFTNQTDIVTLAGGDRVVVQRYRRRQDAEHRLRVKRALWSQIHYGRGSGGCRAPTGTVLVA